MAISKDDVIWCYRIILGREPESEKAIQAHMKRASRSSLREEFFRSREFQKMIAGLSGNISQIPAMPLDLPQNNIETDATATQLAECHRKIKAAWSHLGSTRPHFSVLTNKKYLPKNLSHNLEQFWASGEMGAVRIERILARYGFTSLSTKICLEYGCGVGRVTMGLARRFALVHAYDISQEHLSLAEQRAKAVEISNCRFHLCPDDPFDPLEACDVYFSGIVLQHNPPPIIKHLIMSALHSLKPGGIAIFQVPTYKIGYHFSIKEWLATDHALDMQMHCFPQQVIFTIISESNCMLLEVREDGKTGSDGFFSNTFVVRKIYDSVKPSPDTIIHHNMKASNFLARIIFRAYANELVGAAYSGILERDADAEGLAVYAKRLKKSNDLAFMLKDLSTSDEFWEKILAARAPSLVSVIYQGLIGREPEPGVHQGLAAKLIETHDLKALVDKISRSDELWKKVLTSRAPDLVHMFYLGILDREPEAEAQEHHAAILSETGDLSQLLSEFLHCPEFVKKISKRELLSDHQSRPFLPLNLPKNEIEADATETQLVKCLAKIKAAWSHLGITRPHFSVLTNKQYLPENLDNNLEKFWASGEAEAAEVESMLARHDVDSLSIKTCLEYGCGVGRVSMGLARRFAQIHCYDISQGHLSLAEQRTHEIGISNCRFHLCSENLLDPLEACDFFYSRIVFQHNPPPIIKQLVKNALRALNPAGIAIFQIPTYQIGYRYSIDEWLAADHVLDMQMHCLPQQVVFSIILEENCVLLEVREDNCTGAPNVNISNTFIVRKV